MQKEVEDKEEYEGVDKETAGESEGDETPAQIGEGWEALVWKHPPPLNGRAMLPILPPSLRNLSVSPSVLTKGLSS